ncbi:MAG: helix-hairpin-helix domain-containing protein [Bacteroidetes bacterium]|nr:helix-hairpin-helix domain-containing protein [Bacteroidota bacterium]
MKIHLLLFFLSLHQFSFSQNDIIQESIDYLLSGNQDEMVNTEEIIEQLRVFLNKPVNINIADADSLSQLPLITSEQAKKIIEYREQNGNFSSIYELKHLQFNQELIKLLSHFFKVDTPPIPKADMIFLIRTQLILENQKGYDESSSNHYTGNSSKIYSRFRYNSGHINFGFTTEKDPGESFYDQYQPYAFDFYSGFAQYKQKKSQLIVGDFTVNTGQGLAISNGYRNSFTTSPLYANLFQNQSRPYTSSDENSFFRGLCFRKQLGKFTAQTFLSYKKNDASLNNGNIATLLNTGYHRTLTELNKKDNITEISFGNSLLYQGKNKSISFNNLFYKYSLPYIPDSTYYKANFSQIGWQYVNSIDYSIDFKNINLFGEIALSKQLKAATIHGITISLNEQLSASLRFRYYDPNFTNPYAASYSQSSGIRNETGTDINVLWNVNSNQQLNLSFDVFSHPWLRYGIAHPTQGKEFSLLYQNTFSDQMNFYFRYQFKESDQKYQQLRAHLNWNYAFQSILSLRNEIHFVNGKYSWLTYVSIAHQPKNLPFKIHLRYSLFNVADYDSRIYTYENDLLYSSSLPFFDGGGNRIYSMINYPINKNMSLCLRASMSLYDNKNSIGSDKDLISGNHKSEVKIQLLWRN